VTGLLLSKPRWLRFFGAGIDWRRFLPAPLECGVMPTSSVGNGGPRGQSAVCGLLILARRATAQPACRFRAALSPEPVAY